MIRTIVASVSLLLGLAGPASAQKGKEKSRSSAKSEVKFLNDIEIDVAPSSVQQRSNLSEFELQFFEKQNYKPNAANTSIALDNAHSLQIKYALMLDTEVEQIQNVGLYSGIDQWYGTRYRLGGSTKEGIDCSALVKILYATHYGVNLPRTAREQYDFTHRISRTELHEGDLVFFNTQGGVSHVGIYLQNNKFVHAASSGGVMISDLFDPYWEKRFLGIGRFEKEPAMLSFTRN